MEKINTFLLVDDDPVTNFINKRLLEKLNIAQEVKVVTNGEEGIHCLEDFSFRTKNAPEVILLDINMPVMDGFEFLNAFKEREFGNKDKVVIGILTTSTHPVDKEKMQALGVTHFINKPLTHEKIMNFLGDIRSI